MVSLAGKELQGERNCTSNAVVCTNIINLFAGGKHAPQKDEICRHMGFGIAQLLLLSNDTAIRSLLCRPDFSYTTNPTILPAQMQLCKFLLAKLKE